MGQVMISGVAPKMKAPISGIRASKLAVGSVVKLMEDGVATEYLVVNQGIPSDSSLYDASCDGVWLLRKDIHSSRVWDADTSNVLETSDIHIWLNGDFFNLFGSVEQATIKQVKIPYRRDGGMGTTLTGEEGLPCNVFLLSGQEVGWSPGHNSYFPIEGARLEYFEYGTDTSANNKRIAYLSGSSNSWWLRSQYTNGTGGVWLVNSGGAYSNSLAKTSYGVRPALILPSTAIFDANTMLLKGVS